MDLRQLGTELKFKRYMLRKHEEPDNSAMVEELYLLREILAKQDEKHREDILKLQHQIECLQAKLKENEEREAGLNKKAAEKA